MNATPAQKPSDQRGAGLVGTSGGFGDLRPLAKGDVVQRLVRRLSAWAWEEMLFDVGRVEWKYGRNDNGAPKNWTEWNNVRVHLREAGRLRQPQELDSPNTCVSDGPADAHKFTSSAEGPFAARNS